MNERSDVEDLATPAPPDASAELWPAPSFGDDPFDLTSDDTFEEEATIPVKPRPKATPQADADWPPRAPSPPTRDEPAPAATVATGSSDADLTAGQHVGQGVDLTLAGVTAAQNGGRGTVLTLADPPSVRRPWIPQRDRELHVDTIVRPRRSTGAWLLLVLLVVGVAASAGFLAFRLLPT